MHPTDHREPTQFLRVDHSPLDADRDRRAWLGHLQSDQDRQDERLNLGRDARFRDCIAVRVLRFGLLPYEPLPGESLCEPSLKVSNVVTFGGLGPGSVLSHTTEPTEVVHIFAKTFNLAT